MKPAKPTPKANDYLDINDRLYKQVGELLTQLEAKDHAGETKITLKERIAALIAIGRIQTIFAGLRKKEPDDADAGSSVRKYAGAFKDETGGGKAGGGRRSSGRKSKPEPDDWFEHAAAAADEDADPEFDA
jgi:hypothetical protein